MSGNTKPLILGIVLNVLAYVGGAASGEGPANIIRPCQLRWGHASQAQRLAFSQDGRTVATADGNLTDGHEILLWDVGTRIVRRRFSGVKYWGGAISERGDEIIFVDEQGLKRSNKQGAFEVDSRFAGKAFPQYFDAMAHIGASFRVVHKGLPDRNTGQYHEPGVSDVTTCDITAGRILKKFPVPDVEVSRLVVSPDGTRLAITGLRGHDMVLQVFIVATGERLHEIVLDGHGSGDLKFSHDNRQVFILSCGNYCGWNGCSFREWDLRERKPRDLVSGGWDDMPWEFDVSSDGKLLALQRRQHIELWDRAMGKQLEPPLEGNDHCPPRFSPDGKWLAVGTGSGARLWNVETREHIDLGRRPGNVKALVFDVEGERLISARGNQVEIWNLEGDAKPRVFAAEGAALLSVAFHPRGAQWAAGAADGTVYLWAAADGSPRKLNGHERPVKAVAFDNGGTVLLSGDLDGAIRVWDVKSGTERTKLKADGGVTSFAFRPNAGLLAVGNLENSIELWRTSDWQLEATLKAHESPVVSTGFHPDGGHFASASQDETVIVWDVEKQQPLRKFRAEGSPTVVAFGKPAGALFVGGNFGVQQFDWRAHQKSISVLSRKAEPSSLLAPRTPIAIHPGGRVAQASGETVLLWNGTPGATLSPK